MKRGIAGKALQAGRMEVACSPGMRKVGNGEHRGEGDGQMYVDMSVCYRGSQAL